MTEDHKLSKDDLPHLYYAVCEEQEMLRVNFYCDELKKFVLECAESNVDFADLDDSCILEKFVEMNKNAEQRLCIYGITPELDKEFSDYYPGSNLFLRNTGDQNYSYNDLNKNEKEDLLQWRTMLANTPDSPMTHQDWIKELVSEDPSLENLCIDFRNTIERLVTCYC